MEVGEIWGKDGLLLRRLMYFFAFLYHSFMHLEEEMKGCSVKKEMRKWMMKVMEEDVGIFVDIKKRLKEGKGMETSEEMTNFIWETVEKGELGF